MGTTLHLGAHTPCLRRWILNPWVTREVQHTHFTKMPRCFSAPSSLKSIVYYIIPKGGQIVSLSSYPFSGKMFSSSQSDTFYFQTVVLYRKILIVLSRNWYVKYQLGDQHRNSIPQMINLISFTQKHHPLALDDVPVSWSLCTIHLSFALGRLSAENRGIFVTLHLLSHSTPKPSAVLMNSHSNYPSN